MGTVTNDMTGSVYQWDNILNFSGCHAEELSESAFLISLLITGMLKQKTGGFWWPHFQEPRSFCSGCGL